MGKVVTPHHEHIPSPVHLSLLPKVFQPLPWSIALWYIAHTARKKIRLNKTLWRIVVIKKYMSKNSTICLTVRCAIRKSFELWLPDELKSLFELSILCLLLVHPRKYHRLQAQLYKKLCHGGGVAERVKLPSNFWLYAKCIHQKSVTHLEVSDDVRVIWTSLIV